MNLFLYDPPIGRHEYLTKMHFDPMRAYAHDSAKPVTTVGSVSDARNGTVLVSADHLDAATIATFKHKRFISDELRIALPEAARLWLEGKGREGCWGGVVQGYIASGVFRPTGKRFRSLRKAARGRKQDQYEFAS